MNIKKLFATLAGVSLFAQTVVPFGALAATYSQELQDAYNWAYGKSITTMSPIDNANMYGAITRAELAKMLANWAKDKGQTPDTSKACTFTDTASVKGDLATAIVEACQLGLMGQGITAFRPYDTISRAEFGTALSRALWGDKYEGGTPYYAKHLDALKAAGIMTQIANAESTKEVRGYVMLMLMRSEGSEDTVDCNDAMIKAACVLDSSECPAACKTTEEPAEDVAPKSGDLAVTATPASGRKAILEVASDLDTLTFKTSESVDITKVILERYGYSKGTDVEQVWLEDENGNIISSQTSVNSRDQVSLSIKKDYRTVDGTFNATIVVKLNGNVTTGGTIGFKVVDAESTAKNLNLDNYTPYEYDMVGYTAAKDVTIDSKGSDKSYNYEDGEMYEVAKLKVKASTTAIDVNGFTFTNNGASRTLDLKKFLDKVEVTVDGNAVKGVEYSINKAGELTISFNSVEVAAKSNSVFAVNISLADFDEYGSHVKLELAQPEHFKATEKKTNARITLTGGNMPSSYPEYTFAGSKIKLTNNKLGNLEYAQWASDVVVAEGTISVAEGVEKVATSNRFVVTGSYTLASGDVFSGKVIEQMRLLIAGEEYPADPVSTNSGAVFTFPQNIEIEKSGKFQVVVDLNTDNDAPAGTKITFEGTFDDLVFSGAEYTDSNRSVVDLKEVSGVISFAKQLTVQAGKSSFTNSLTKGVEFLDNEVETKTVFDGTYTAKKNDVNLLDFVVSGATATGVTTTFYLYIDGKEVADVRLSGSGAIATGSDSISKVKVAAGESIKVRIDAEVNAKKVLSTSVTWVDLAKYDIVINWEDDNNNPIDTKAVKTVQMKIVGSETIKITDASAAKANDVALRGTETTLAQFTVKPSKGDSARFEDFVFSGTYSGSAKYEADDLVVTLGNDELECTGNDNITCEVNDDVKSEGATVTIKLADANKAEGDVKISVTKLNNEPVSKTFEKKFLDAVVRVVSQKFNRATTVFKLDVELYDETPDPENITFTPCNWGSGFTYTGTLTDGKEITFENGTNAALICEVQYGSYSALKKDVVEDYFKKIPVEWTSDTDDLMVDAVSTK